VFESRFQLNCAALECFKASGM